MSKNLLLRCLVAAARRVVTLLPRLCEPESFLVVILDVESQVRFLLALVAIAGTLVRLDLREDGGTDIIARVEPELEVGLFEAVLLVGQVSRCLCGSVIGGGVVRVVRSGTRGNPFLMPPFLFSL